MLSTLLVAFVVQAPAETREQRVLDLLSGAERSGSYRYSSAIFESEPPRLGSGPVLVAAFYDVYCANADSGTFDDARARSLALELSAIYGLAIAADQQVTDGDRSFLLDGLDRSEGIGFKLRGRGNPEQFGEAVVEADATALDEAEFAWLDAQGFRVHVADVAQYRGYGDEFTPTLAYLAGLVRFLNEVTEGEDVDLGGLLFEREATWEWSASMPAGMRISRVNYGVELTVERAGTVATSCRGLAEFGPPSDRDPWGFTEEPEASRERRRLTGSTCGAPSVLLFHAEASPLVRVEPLSRPRINLRVRQYLDGTEFVHQGRSFVAFLPSAFDLAQPFDVEFDLPPGRYTIYGPALIGAAARD